MATLTKAINKNLFDSILPSFGNPRVHIPVWDDSQKMFICDEFESNGGHRYYRGIRFCDRIVIMEKVGLYHSWTYIDSIELYAFNGQKMELIQKRDYDKVFRSEGFIRQESEQMVKDYGVPVFTFMTIYRHQCEAAVARLHMRTNFQSEPHGPTVRAAWTDSPKPHGLTVRSAWTDSPKCVD